MIEVSANVGGLDVVASGVLHVSSEIIDAKISGMPMQIRFLSGEPLGETKYDTEVVDNTLILNLRNFNSPFPEGQFEPTSVGTVEGRSLLMAFTVVTLDRAKQARMFTYTFYLGAER